MQNIPLFEHVFSKVKDKNIAGLAQSLLQPQLTLVHDIIFPSHSF